MQEVLVSKIFNYTSTPTKNVEGQFWFNPSTNVLSRFNGTTWKPITVSSDDVAVLTDGNKVSLTSYLNTQIAALAEGIDSKQDKLVTYKETSISTYPALGELRTPYDTVEIKARAGNFTETSGGLAGKIELITEAPNEMSNGGIINLTSNGCYHASGGEINLNAIGESASSNTISLNAGAGYYSAGLISLSAGGDKSDYSDVQGQIKLTTSSENDKTTDSIILSSSNIQLDGSLKGTALKTSISSDADDSHVPTTKAVKTELDKKQNNLSLYSEGEVDNAAGWVNIGKDTSKISAGAGDVTLTATQNITLDAGSTIEIKNATSISGSVIANSISSEDTGISGQIPTVGAVATSLNTKQDKLSYYSEVLGSTSSVARINLKGSVQEGSQTSASGNYSHAEGEMTIASGKCSHAEGESTKASGVNSHAEGWSTTASGDYSHAEGWSTTASGKFSHAEGYNSFASGKFSHVEGCNTSASSQYQHVQGKFNLEDTTEKYADIIGNGTSYNANSNAATVSWDGISWSQTDVRAGGTDQDNAAYSLSALAEGIDSKQDKLVSYSETTLPPEAGTAGGKTTVDINALSLQITTDTNLGGSAIFKGGSVYVESKLWTNELVVSESITGNAVLSSISSKPVDTKILSEKAIKTELDKKQDTLKTFSENKTDPNTYTVNINASQTCINSKLEVKDTLSTDGNIELGGKIMRDGVDVLATKQDSLKYYSEDTTKAVSKLSSKRLEVIAYNTDGNTYNPLILNDKQGIAIGGNNPSAQDLYAYLNIGDNDGTSLMLSTPVGYSDLRYDGITFKDTNDNLQFGFNNKTYNLLTERAAGLYYLKDTDAKSTGIAIDPDRISLIDYNKYSDDPYISDTSDSHCFFESTKISNGQIQLQTRINGSSEFINEGTISPDCIKLGSGRFGSALDPLADIVITTTQTEDTFAGHFHGIAYDGDTYGDGANNRWYIGTDVDKTGQSSKPIIGKPYIKGFANAEFSETVQATTIQAGKEVSANSGVAALTEGGLSINTPAGVASFKYDGIEISNAGFKVHGQNGTSTVYPYVQIPDSNGNSFKIWKGTEEQFKALTVVKSDTVYLRVQDNNRIKATVGTDTASLENITDSYTLSSNTFTSFITDTKYNNAQGSILITPSLTNSGALIFGEGITDTSKGFPLYPDNIVSIPFKNITNFKVAGNLNDSFNYIVSFDI